MELPVNYKEEYYKILLDCLYYVQNGNSIRATAAIGLYEDYERRIISALGTEGERVILEIKGLADGRARELGIGFFTGQLDDLRDRRRVRTLYPVPYEFNLPRVTCDVDLWLSLTDAEGEVLDYNIYATIIFEGNMYLEIIYPDEIKTRRRLAYYRVEQQSSKILLTLLEDEALHKKLSDITDRLI